MFVGPLSKMSVWWWLVIKQFIESFQESWIIRLKLFAYTFGVELCKPLNDH